MTLVLMGGSHGETEPKKATYLQAGRNSKTPTSLKTIPAVFSWDNGKSPGDSVVEVATPKGAKQSNRGNEKKRIEGQREVEP
jgi:hypothetical protein